MPDACGSIGHYLHVRERGASRSPRPGDDRAVQSGPARARLPSIRCRAKRDSSGAVCPARALGKRGGAGDAPPCRPARSRRATCQCQEITGNLFLPRGRNSGGACVMADKIRLGMVGANINANWALESHYPALLASPDVELTAVCTTRRESAEEARDALGARFAFSDWREMVKSPEIDAVAVVVKVTEHFGPTKGALEAGKHVFTEWPLGKNSAEAEELAALARGSGLQTVVGLQAR